jgi:hypothetical protein
MRQLSLAALAVFVLAAGARADDIRIPITVRPGALRIAPLTVTARGSEISLTVVDARGSGAGWSVLARAGGPLGRATVTGVETRCGSHSTCTVPRTTVRYPLSLSAFRLVSVLAAARGTGMGTVVVTIKLAASTRPGTGLSFAVRPG